MKGLLFSEIGLRMKLMYMSIFFSYLNLMTSRKALMVFFMNHSKNCWEKIAL